jgi:hypothetical protein
MSDDAMTDWRKHSFRMGGLLMSLAAIAAIGGCQQQAPEKPIASPPAPAAEVKLDTPTETARTLVHFLRGQLAAAAAHDKAAGQAQRAQVVWHVIDRDALLAQFAEVPGRSTTDPAVVLDRLVQSWASALLYYADGLELDAARVVQRPGGSKAIVRVAAHGPNDDALLAVACQRGPDDAWRVIGMEFVNPASLEPTTQAATMPATTQATK